ncbi:AraC family transcriptional regulator [Nocardia abscessus]|uniref:AraC family transcriptional regulator n=1 Tax=Nocardia abscessus TaxID=120957 RepID=UPI00030117F7|nr:AraC family transcriptional regulator ligand-binding domain-containing protein [Nocardia abscessus]MCC3327332.1 AraC family transcriptional regulator ligand-binding domain-containing protein [Nocardia abscessus]
MNSRVDPVSEPSPGGSASPPNPLDGTASTHLTRLVRDTARAAGVPADRLAAVPGTDDAALASELNRIPLHSLARLWDLLARTRTGPGAGLSVAAAAPLGTLTTWDYLLANGPTLADSLRTAQPYHRLVTAAEEGFDLTHDRALTVGFRTTAPDPEAVAVINEYVLAYYLRRAREATGRPVIPERVAFSRPAPPDHRVLAEAFGTDRIDFGAPVDAITFTEADATAPLVRADPLLADLLRSHADLVLATARPIPGPLESFRLALASAIADSDASLGAVARRLAVSTRTLQRQLAEQNTTWREEYDRARYEQARSLLAEGRLTTAAIAGRLGFTDDRALRKAYRRWSGSPPSQARGR